MPPQGKGFDVTVTGRSLEKISKLRDKGLVVSTDNYKAVSDSDAVLIALKPSDAMRLLPELSSALANRILISMMAAMSLSRLRALCPDSTIVRAMTNVAAMVGGGYTVYCSEGVDSETDSMIANIFACLGDFEKVEESHMDALTAISGSGPAYIFTVIEAMTHAGLKVGLPRELALRSSCQTVLGSAKLVAEGEYHPSELKDLVTTPGGVTIDALYELEDSGIRSAFMRAVEAATRKARTISDFYDQDR